jgi:xanthine dehydrogenase YagS FAD-binding subunit
MGNALPCMTFRYQRASSFAQAFSALGETGSVPLGGGTDLLLQIEEQLVSPSLLVDLRGIDEASRIEELSDGSLRIGAAVPIETIARDERVRARYVALAEACDSVGTTALRHMGTLGGNLCQRPRCWYLRRAIPCLKNGGDSCPAATGENQYHAILEGGPCHIVHPSDPAVALAALEATVEVGGAGGKRLVPMSDFHPLPSERLDLETVLRPGEIVTSVHLPAGSAGGRQSYVKQMQRGAWDFALVSLATVRVPDGDVRLVLGGVAPRPWRVPRSVEEDVASGGLALEDVATLADRAFYDARPLGRNGYKVELAAALLRRGIGGLLDA